MITGAQIRGARAMIGLSLEELAAASNLSTDIIRTIEQAGHAEEPGALSAIKAALELRGIIFLASGNQNEGGPGIRLRTRDDSDDGIRPENLNAANDD